MRKSIFLVLAMFLAAFIVGTGCTDKKPEAADTMQTDTILSDSLESDSLDEIIAEQPMPKAADELFDDFIFNFAASKVVQRERTEFPLSLNSYGKETSLQQNQWSMEHFFMRQGYYTLVFNNVKQMDLVKDTSIGSVFVEKISFEKNQVKRWNFNRVNGLWKLQAVKLMALSSHEDAHFLKFYQSFATDSTTQTQSLADHVIFTGPDPDDDFSRMEGELMPEQWPMFAPWLPSGTIFNIHYGDKPYKASNTRLFIVRGIANGLETELTFQTLEGKWKLIKINT